MFTVNVQKECGCFKRSDLQNNQTFEEKDSALITAINMRDKMNDEFCGKHEFSVKEDGETFSILVEEPSKGGCCGGGHCS
jgi:hypothetical protein